MSAADQRDVGAETSRIEDGLAILAALVEDMLAGTDRAGTGDTPTTHKMKSKVPRHPRTTGSRPANDVWISRWKPECPNDSEISSR